MALPSIVSVAPSSSVFDPFQDLEQLQLLKLQGRDKLNRPLLRVVGKFLPATVIDKERLKNYVLHKISNEFEHTKFAILYLHTAVQRSENSPGILILWHIYEALSARVKSNLEVVYYVHPGLISRLLFATFGRFFLSDGLYSKLKYISRIEFLWNYMQQEEVNIPDFVVEHDHELEDNPLKDYGLSADLRTPNHGSEFRRTPYSSGIY